MAARAAAAGDLAAAEVGDGVVVADAAEANAVADPGKATDLLALSAADVVVVGLSVLSLAALGYLFTPGTRGGQAIRRAESPKGEGPHRLLMAAFAGFFLALILANFTTPGVPPAAVEPSLWVRTLAGAVTFLVVVAVAWGGVDSIAELGMRRRNVEGQVALGIVAGLASLAPTFAVLAAIGTEEGEHPLLTSLRGDPHWANWVAAGLSAVILAPASEELAFRGVIQNGLARRIPPEPAIIVTAMLFACVHPLQTIPALVPFAFGVGFVYHQTQSLIASAAMHATFNASMLTATLVGVLSE